MYQLVFKKLMDIGVAILVLLLTSPVLITSIILLTVVNNGKPFFFQKRPGRNSKIFSIIKLKTMNDKRDENGELLPDSERLTMVGKVIRKLSLDELPQLINVLKGDMSLIGPRPLLIQYLPLYNERQARRHEVRPGITGWAQVNGRNTLDWATRFEYDVWYVENQSFALDLRIFFLTISKVLKSEGISQEGEATVQYFEGTK